LERILKVESYQYRVLNSLVAKYKILTSLSIEKKEDKLRCLNCHLYVGHNNEEAQQTEFSLTSFEEKKEIHQQPARIDSFKTFIETIPGSSVSFKMVAIPGGTFRMGSAADQAFRDSDEGPQRRVHLTAFWMAEHEVSWDEYLAFYQQTSGSGRTEDQMSAAANGVDAITGPTPPSYRRSIRFFQR
jgi:formylglycine-generating enzyme required for sulfatase activity